MTNRCLAAVILLMLILCFTACSTTQESISSGISSASSQADVVSVPSSSESSSSSSSSTESSKSASSKSSPVFTNKFGTATTVCNHSGCANYIASTGDTNCCTTHSKTCLECGKYIDEDAAWCMSCLETAANQVIDEKEKIQNQDCDICKKPATETINGEYFCDKHYVDAAAWYLEQAME